MNIHREKIGRRPEKRREQVNRRMGPGQCVFRPIRLTDCRKCRSTRSFHAPSSIFFPWRLCAFALIPVRPSIFLPQVILRNEPIQKCAKSPMFTAGICENGKSKKCKTNPILFNVWRERISPNRALHILPQFLISLRLPCQFQSLQKRSLSGFPRPLGGEGPRVRGFYWHTRFVDHPK